MYKDSFPLFVGFNVNQTKSFAPGDRILDLVRGVIKSASNYVKQDVKFSYKNGEVEYSDTLPSWWMFADGPAQMDAILSDMDLRRQQIMFCKPDVVEFDIIGLSPDQAKRFTVHVRVRNCLGSFDGPVTIAKGEPIFPNVAGGIPCPATAQYFPHILGNKEQGLRYGDKNPTESVACQLFYTGEMGFGMDASYDVSTQKGSIEILASSNLFSNLTTTSRQVKNESMQEYVKGKKIPESPVALVSVPVQLKLTDLGNHAEENSSADLAVEAENPLNFPVIFEIKSSDEVMYHAGFPQKLLMKNGKIVPASTVKKMITLGCLLEDDLFNDNIHDVGKRNKVLSSPAIRKVSGGYIIRVNLYDSGDTFTDDLPDFMEWVDTSSYVGEFLSQMEVKNQQLGFFYHGFFRALYGQGTTSCCFLTLATLASAVTRMSNKPANQATICTTIRYLMCARRSLQTDVEGGTNMYVKFDDEDGFNQYKMQIPEGELAYYASSKNYVEVASDTVIKAESVGNYMILKTKKSESTHFRIVRLNKAGPVGPDSFKIIWDSMGFYEAYDFGLAMAERIYLRGLRTYEVRVSVNSDRLVILYGDTGNFMAG